MPLVVADATADTTLQHTTLPRPIAAQAIITTGGVHHRSAWGTRYRSSEQDHTEVHAEVYAWFVAVLAAIRREYWASQLVDAVVLPVGFKRSRKISAQKPRLYYM